MVNLEVREFKEPVEDEDLAVGADFLDEDNSENEVSDSEENVVNTDEGGFDTSEELELRDDKEILVAAVMIELVEDEDEGEKVIFAAMLLLYLINKKLEEGKCSFLETRLGGTVLNSTRLLEEKELLSAKLRSLDEDALAQIPHCVVHPLEVCQTLLKLGEVIQRLNALSVKRKALVKDLFVYLA